MGMHKRARRDVRRRRAGFSLIEAMVASGVLGIALAALVGLHTGAMRGTLASNRLGEATEIARGLADHYALRALGTPAGCAPTQAAVLAATPVCGNILTLPAAAVCTSPNDCDAVIAGPGACIYDIDLRGDMTAPGAAPPLPGRYRVQVLESLNFGTSPSPGFRVTVVVCWNDAENGSTRSRGVSASRLSVLGL